MVRWAPLNIPLRRRLQMGAVAAMFFFPVFLSITVAAGLLFSPALRWAFLVAIAWQLILDRRTPSQGGRPWKWIRSVGFLRLIVEYFSARLELPKAPNGQSCFDPSKSYIFALHPHGIICASAITNLVFNINDPIGRLGVPYRVCTVTANFIIPIWREFVLAFGFVSADRASVSWCLQHGVSVAIVVGGAKESLQARPGSTELTLASRKGFVRLALQHGAPLVPCFHFGEVELFSQLDNPPGSWVRAFQELTRRTLGFTTPFFSGRGIFNYDVGLLPRRVPLTTVIGRPIDVPKIESPTADDVDTYHAKYVLALQSLYNNNAPRYAPKAVDARGHAVPTQPLRIL